jgi:hypothetical protein
VLLQAAYISWKAWDDRDLCFSTVDTAKDSGVGKEGTPSALHDKIHGQFQRCFSNSKINVMVHSNAITIFLIEITANKCFISHDNPLNYSVKYGRTAEFRNFGSNVSFIAENLHLIESNNRESLECSVTTFCFVISTHSRAVGNSEDR